MSKDEEKVSVYSIPDLKFKSDEALPNYLNSLGFTQSHALTDLRLGLGFAALAVAAACFYWDYKLGFYDTKYYSLAAVVVYALLNLAITGVTYVQGGTVYVGTAPGGEDTVIRISTKSPKYEPIYDVKVTVTTKAGKATVYTIKRSFAEWFDSAGHFVARPFQTMLATSVPVIGAADPKRVAAASSAAASADEASPEYSAAMLDILAAAAAAEESSASTPGDVAGTESDAAKASGASTGNNGGKRRKA